MGANALVMQIGSIIVAAFVAAASLGLGGCSNASTTPAKTALAAPAPSGGNAIYMVGGQVTGLRGIGLTLRDGRGEVVRIKNDGSFVFASPMQDKARYTVAIEQEPIAPVQACSLDRTTGTIDGGDAIEISVICKAVSITFETDNVLTPAETVASNGAP